MTTDWKALCAELVDNIHRGSSGMLGWTPEQEDELLERARAALSQPEPEGPTRRQLSLLAEHFFPGDSGWREEEILFARAVLTRWGCPAIEPVPVTERLPWPPDCDAEGMCWWWDKDELSWTKGLPEYCAGSYGPWLPHHALPVPIAQC